MKLSLLKKVNETESVVAFYFEKPADFSWRPGQYLEYTLPHQNPDNRGVKRYFSISSAPYEDAILITTRINEEKSSSFKKALLNMQPNDIIEADNLEGEFVVTEPEKNYVFIAGGIGITPFRAILLDLNKKALPINVTLVYANRDENFVFKNELEELTKTNPNFKIEYVVDPKRIDEEVLVPLIKSIDNPMFYVSGPAPMVFAQEELLKRLGVKEGQIKLDDFPGYTWPMT